MVTHPGAAYSGERATGRLVGEVVGRLLSNCIFFNNPPPLKFVSYAESYFLWGEHYQLIEMMKFFPHLKTDFIFSNGSQIAVFLFMKTSSDNIFFSSVVT